MPDKRLLSRHSLDVLARRRQTQMPPLPDVFGDDMPPLPSEFGPVAVPTGTTEKPPTKPIYGPNDPRSRAGRTAIAFPPAIQKVADILSPPGTPSRKVFSVLGAMSTVDPERDVAAELQQAHPIEKLMMGLPVGAPVGSLAGTAGRGVLTQTGRAATTAAQKAAPVARRLATEEAGAIRPMTPGVSRPTKPGPIAFPDMPGEHGRRLTTPGVSRPLTPRISRPKQLSEAEERLRVLGEQRAVAEVRLELLQSGQEIVIPPRTTKGGIGLWSPAKLKALAIHEGLDYRKTDWWDSIDSAVVKELRTAKLGARETVASLTREIRTLKAEEQQLGGTIQAGMGIGERPAQGGLFENLRGEADKIPLADTEQMALRADRRAQIAAGQAEMPITTPVASEALSPTAKAAQATEGVSKKATNAFIEARAKYYRDGGYGAVKARRTAEADWAQVPPENQAKVIQDFTKTPVGAETRVVSESVQQGSKVAPAGAKAAAAQAPLPAYAAPPTVPPRQPPAPPTTPAGPNIPPYIEPPMMGKNVLGMKPIQAGLSKSEEIANIARRTVGKVGVRLVEDNPLVSGAFKERARLKSVADSQAGRLSTKHGTALGKAFTLDKQGRVTNLAGVDATLPGAPTIQDVAARLPRYWGSLSSEQQQAMIALRRDVTPYRSLLDEVGVEVPARADVIEGGFYLPRGRADLEGADLPLKVATGLGRGGKKGFERPAVFESQAAGIDAGYEYPAITDTLSAYARDAGNRATDAHIATFFKTATDETGQLLGNTPKMRLKQQNPAVAKKMQDLKDSLDRLKRLSASLTNRQLEVIDKWQLDPTFDDLDVLLDGLKTMRGGRGAGMTAPEMRTALTATRQAIHALAPEYKVALRRAQATPRLEGAVGLPGLQGWAFPDEIANAANLILKGEGPPTGLAAKPVAVANAFNNLYRGAKATLDNSAIGIQGLLGAADDPVAYAKAVGVNFRAWGPGGERALGRFITTFDETAVKTARLTSDDWARANLRIGGAQTEFQLGAGVSEKLTRLPVVRQANRAFGYFGDALRLDWADDMLAAELRRGKSIQQLWDAGDVERIANVANNMTGWAQGKAFGSMGDLLLFAPRFLQSRAETLVKGVAGLRSGASIGQRAARRSLLKMMGYGAIITVAANEMMGNETDFRPIIKVRRRNDWQYTWNPNFMRIRFMGRDWTIYGTWDSFARAITVTAMGRPQEALRGLGSGTLTAAWDIIGDRDFDGNKVRDNPVNFGKWLLESMLPFSVPEAVAIGKGGVGAVQEGDVKQAAGAAVATFMQLQGAKSSPVTLKDKLGIQDTEFEDYFAIPSNPLEVKARKYETPGKVMKTREEYRTAHPDVDAKLFITGTVDSLQTWTAKIKAVQLMRENDIGVKDIRSLEKKPYESKDKAKLRSYLERALGATSQPSSAPSSLPGVSADRMQELLREYGIAEPTPEPVGAR